MDFTPRFDKLEPNRRMVQTWAWSSGIRLKFVLAAKSRLGILGLIACFKHRNRLAGVVSDEETALHYVKLHRPGMLFCTDQLEEGDSYSLVARARALVPDLRVMMIMCTANPNVERAIALKIEMICLEEDILTPELPVAYGLITAFQGKHFVTPRAQKLLNRALSSEETDATSMLTPKEKTIMELMIRGLSDQAIADHLHLSIHTVRDYNKSIRSKFGVKTRMELAAMKLRTSFGFPA